MTDFLLELLSEEIPARMQAKARMDLERLFAEQMTSAGLKTGEIITYSTPRRLALIAKGLPDKTEAVSEEAKGPPEGAPDQAIEGFCRKNGVSRDDLELRDVKGRATYFAVINKPGRRAADVLAEIIPAIIKAFPWPKSMRWGTDSITTESLRWVRPLSGIVAIFGKDLVECNIGGVTSGYETAGHRFHHQGVITIGGADDYTENLRACHVIVDHAEREHIIRDGAAKAASDAGLVLVTDEGLVIENAGLTEWPVPMLGAFDPAFLEVPEEVIQLTTRVNQKYFVCRDKSGALAPNFICTANIDAHDGGKAIVAGNEKVLAARLSDAKFFWELDQKTSLEDQNEKLKSIVFHEKLGTVADKVERVVKLAEWLVSLEGNGFYQSSPGDTFHSEVSEAARLCKADLVTEMVGEFPELQGIMGGYYAEKEGKSQAVANAIRDHYKPVGQGDEVPTDPVTVIVSLADKLDTILSFLSIDLAPTGSRDPFAIRRAMIAIEALMLKNEFRGKLTKIADKWLSFAFDQMSGDFQSQDQENLHADARNKQIIAIKQFVSQKGLNLICEEINEALEPKGGDRGRFSSWFDMAIRGKNTDFKEFFHLFQVFAADRLKVQQREAGVRHDLIDAVFALGGEDDLVRLLARVKALQAFVETEDGKNLLAGYKRAANILKKELGDSASENTPEQAADASIDWEPAEKNLLAALDAAEPKAAAAIEAEDFEGAMAALSTLRARIDEFYGNLMVNDKDPAKRAFRLALLSRVRDAVHKVADFSKIEG